MKTTTSFEHIAEIWDTKVGNNGAKMVGVMRETTKNIIAEIGLLKNKRIYEIACGNGFLARQLAPKVKEIRASDISEKLIDFAKNKYNSKDIKYEVREGSDFSRIQKNHFDVVIIHQGIFYIENIEKLAKGISRILKPNGILIFSEMHPLMYLASADTYLKFGKEDLIDRAKLYIKNRKIKVHKDWFVNGKKHHAEYYQLKRPLSLYVNTFAKYGLFTIKIIEPKTVNLIKDKILKTNIPSSYIVKCVKV